MQWEVIGWFFCIGERPVDILGLLWQLLASLGRLPNCTHSAAQNSPVTRHHFEAPRTKPNVILGAARSAHELTMFTARFHACQARIKGINESLLAHCGHRIICKHWLLSMKVLTKALPALQVTVGSRWPELTDLR